MSFWRKELPVLDDSGRILLGGMWDAQRQWWESKSFYKALVTGYGGGKTFIAGKRAISLALQNAPAPHISVSPSYKIAKRTIIPTIRALLQGKQTLHHELQYSYNKSDFEFTIKYHGRLATIWILSGDDPQSLKGPNVGSANIDEPFIMDREVFDQVVARVRDPLADTQEIGLTGTPEELNWGYDICEGEEADNFDLELIQASTKENKALPPGYIERLYGSLTEKAAQAYVEGKFVSLADGLVYYAFSEANVQDLPLPEPNYPLGLGMDFNVDPMAAVVFWNYKNHVHVIDEIELPNADTQYMLSVVRERYGEQCNDAYPDASGRARHSVAPAGRSDFHYIREAGFDYHCHSVNPRVRDRENAVNGKFRSHNGDITLTISPKCKRLKHYLMQFSHKKKNQQKSMSHLLDALGYPVAYLYPVRQPSVITRLHGA